MEKACESWLLVLGEVDKDLHPDDESLYTTRRNTWVIVLFPINRLNPANQ